uniref:Uncharacterized protein n=1 Tax=Tanacetum cinerariifolium TaxID=118510 RepID=A0A699KME8_TANCI|nr:hypothetical protein [Tanacetum cinerariifolium]
MDANLMREALEITPIDQAHQFMSPPSGDAIMDFVNELGYIEVIHFVSRMAGNNLYQPWRVILSMINQCLTSKTSGTHNIHQRSASPFHLAEEDLRLGNLKFVPKGEDDEHDRKVAAEKGGKKKPATAKQLKSKPAKEKLIKPSPTSKPRSLLMVEDKGKAMEIDEQVAQSLLALHTPKRRSTTDQFIFQRQTSATDEESTGPSAQPQDDTSTNIVQQGEDVDDQVNLEENTAELDQGQDGSDPGKTLESRPPPEQEFLDEDQAGPDPEKAVRLLLD